MEKINIIDRITKIIYAYDRDHLTEKQVLEAVARVEKEAQQVDWSRF